MGVQEGADARRRIVRCVKVPGVSFLLEAPTSGKTAEVQVAKTGNFSDPRYGEFSITNKDFDTWIENFHVLNAEAGLPIDVDHSPEKRGETEAVGWVRSLFKRGTGLWAKVEWNDLGKQLVGDKRYRFISPSYKDDFTDEEGKHHGTALLGVALTNRPFLQMATVSLTAAFALEKSPTPDDGDEDKDNRGTSDSRRQMPLDENIAKALGVDADADESAVLQAIDGLKAPAEQKTLDALAKEHGKVVLDVATVTQLSADAKAGAEAAKTLAENRFEQAFDKALDKTSVLPAEKEDFKVLYDAAPDATIKILESRQPLLGTEATGHGRTMPVALASEFSDPNGSMGVDEEMLEVHNQALTLQKADTTLSYEDAVNRVYMGSGVSD